jgi:hypothetical protein
MEAAQVAPAQMSTLALRRLSFHTLLGTPLEDGILSLVLERQTSRSCWNCRAANVLLVVVKYFYTLLST